MKGRVDIWINNNLKLVIELLVAGEKVTKHINRAKDKYQLQLDASHLRVIDFRAGQAVRAREDPLPDCYVTVDFKDNFAFADVEFFHKDKDPERPNLRRVQLA